MVKLIRCLTAFIMANPYKIIRWDVLEKGIALIKQEGYKRYQFAQRLIDVTRNEEDQSFVIAALLMQRPIEAAVAVLDILIYVNKAIFDDTRDVIIREANEGNQKAIELLATYLIVCPQDPNLVYNLPEPLRNYLIQEFKEKFNINMMEVRLPLVLLQTAFFLVMIFPFVGIGLVITKSQFFFHTNMGFLLFWVMFILSFWLQRAGKLIHAQIFRKKQEQ